MLTINVTLLSPSNATMTETYKVHDGHELFNLKRTRFQYDDFHHAYVVVINDDSDVILQFTAYAQTWNKTLVTKLMTEAARMALPGLIGTNR